jgi:hypothetical protein
MTEEQRERWNKNRRERYANSPEVRERHRLSQEKWVAKKLKANPNFLSDYRKKWRKKKQSVFKQITASPEVLAEKLVFWGLGGWTSHFIDFSHYDKAEAIAATVAKLKEVYNETTSN